SGRAGIDQLAPRNPDAARKRSAEPRGGGQAQQADRGRARHGGEDRQGAPRAHDAKNAVQLARRAGTSLDSHSASAAGNAPALTEWRWRLSPLRGWAVPALLVAVGYYLAARLGFAFTLQPHP